MRANVKIGNEWEGFGEWWCLKMVAQEEWKRRGPMEIGHVLGGVDSVDLVS